MTKYEILMTEFIQEVLQEKKVTLLQSDEWAIHMGFKYFVMSYNKEDFLHYHETSFKTYCIQLNSNISHCSEITLSILHEIGHYKNRDHQFQNHIQYLSAIAHCQTDFQYYDLPEEREATQWGIYFILNHSQLIQDFEKQLQQITHPLLAYNKIMN